MRLKTLIAILLCLSICGLAFSQSKNRGRKKTPEGQRGYSNIELQYGQDRHCYTFDVKGGEVSWDYSGPDGSRTGTFRCNGSVNGNVIASECKGVVNWYFTWKFVSEMVDKKGSFDKFAYNMAIQSIEASLIEFEKARETSPEAYNRIQHSYLELKNAEGKGEQALWRTIVSLAAEDHTLAVADLHDYNF